MSRLYVLTQEIIEIEDYEGVPVEGTQIQIVGDTKTRAGTLSSILPLDLMTTCIQESVYVSDALQMIEPRNDQ